jgi:hypothetical protein
MKSVEVTAKVAKTLSFILVSAIFPILPLSVIANEFTYYTCEIRSTASVGEGGKVKVTPDTDMSKLRITQFVIQKETGDVHGGLINLIGKPSRKVLYERGGKGNFFKVIWQFESPRAPGILYLSIQDDQNKRIMPPFPFTGIVHNDFITGLCS